MSFRDDIPPDAITGVFTANKSSFKLDVFGPCSMPSFDMSVKIMAQGDVFPISLAKSIAIHSHREVQPFTATLPFFASIPTAIRPGNVLQSSSTHDGESMAFVPTITRSVPRSSIVLIDRVVLSPPPNSMRSEEHTSELQS